LKKQNKKSIIEYYDRESPEATEIRRLYSHIARVPATDGEWIRSLAVTSSTLGEGKSTLASMLAISIADHARKNVLLVDSDFRRPKIHEMFNLELGRGFSDILAGDQSGETAVKGTPFTNLKIITAGRRHSNLSKILDRVRLKEFFDKAKHHFDYIILDCPPVIPVSDIIDLSPEIDGVMMVIKAGQTPKEVTKRAVNLLQNYGVKIVGLVLNDVERVLPYYYDYSYYHYRPTKPETKEKPIAKAREVKV